MRWAALLLVGLVAASVQGAAQNVEGVKRQCGLTGLLPWKVLKRFPPLCISAVL